MCFFRKNKTKKLVPENSKFHLKDYVDFWHKDDVYFGVISDIYFGENNEIFYDIEIAGQCPTTYNHVNESKIIRIHK